jgi:NADPH:quinone reductase-like Zn-dependent oxidoreductase
MYSLGADQVIDYTQEDFIFMNELLKAGNVVPVNDRWYPLSEVSDALHYLKGGHAQGKVVITVVSKIKT